MAQPPCPADVKFNDVLELLLSHKSVRAYLPQPVPDGVLETIVAAAQSASSSSNLQVWSVVAVQDAERKARLSVLAGNQKHIAQAPLFLVWLADLARLDQQAANRGLKAEGLDFLESLLLGVIDCALAAQNAVLALESMGLASVYIGGIRNQTEGVAAELGCRPRYSRCSACALAIRIRRVRRPSSRACHSQRCCIASNTRWPPRTRPSSNTTGSWPISMRLRECPRPNGASTRSNGC